MVMEGASAPEGLQCNRCGIGVQIVADAAKVAAVDFSRIRQRAFSKLFSLYQALVVKHGGIDNCHDLDVDGVWTFYTWLHIICRYVNALGDVYD